MNKEKKFQINKVQLNYYKVTISMLFEVYLKKCKSEEEFELACRSIECIALYFKSKAYENGITLGDFLFTKIS